MATTQKITSNLWFDDQAEEAATFYTSIFKNSHIGKITRYGKAGYEFHRKAEGSAMTVEFFIEGQQFVALNGGPDFKFNEAISFIVNCDTQEELDYYWERLSEGGDEKAQMCGWLKDKFGVSWQIVPSILTDLLNDASAGQSEKVTEAIFKMKKLDIVTLQNALLEVPEEK